MLGRVQFGEAACYNSARRVALIERRNSCLRDVLASVASLGQHQGFVAQHVLVHVFFLQLHFKQLQVVVSFVLECLAIQLLPSNDLAGLSADDSIFNIFLSLGNLVGVFRERDFEVGLANLGVQLGCSVLVEDLEFQLQLFPPLVDILLLEQELLMGFVDLGLDLLLVDSLLVLELADLLLHLDVVLVHDLSDLALDVHLEEFRIFAD